MPKLREAMRAERKVALDYVDAHGAPTQRIIWPVALGFMTEYRVVAAWCEARAAFRHFRVDRIAGLTITTERFPRRRRVLLAEWRKAEGLEG
jgi:predicted DNA-binding transcriptional regulator YafY